MGSHGVDIKPQRVLFCSGHLRMGRCVLLRGHRPLLLAQAGALSTGYWSPKASDVYLLQSAPVQGSAWTPPETRGHDDPPWHFDSARVQALRPCASCECLAQPK